MEGKNMNQKEAEERLFILDRDILYKKSERYLSITCPHCKKDIDFNLEPSEVTTEIFVTYGKNQKELDLIEKLLHDGE